MAPSDQSPASARRLPTSWAWALLFLATAFAYLPAIRAGFVWDDDGFVLRPDLHTWSGLGRIWSDPGATEQYYPVLHSAFWLEHRLWGDAAMGYHSANVLLHAAAAGLFALVLSRLRFRREVSLLAAFLFALHPVAVESVAWISEQKNTLSTVFYLLAALAYLRWREPAAAGTRRSSLYVVATWLFLLALLSKSVTATLPAALLVVGWWRQGRLSWRRDVVPLLPWFALGAAAGIFTGWVERAYLGAQGTDFALSFPQRCLVAGRAIWFYLGRLLWPANLIFIYPHWTVAVTGRQLLFPLGALALLAAAWLVRRRSRAPLAVLLLFVGTLFPTLGFFNVYAFVFSYVADHWQYLASLGIIAGAAAGWGTLPRVPGRIVAVVVLAALGGLTWRQSRMYDNPEAFYRTILERNPDAWMAHDNLGVILARTGRGPEAIGHYERALRLKPDWPETYDNLGTALVETGRWPEAIAAYGEAVRLRPNFPSARRNLAQAHDHVGNALGNAGRLTEAMAEYDAALAADPADAEAEADLGFALANLGRYPEALARLDRALQLKPDDPSARAYLGFVFFRTGRWSEAIEQYGRALAARPGDADLHYNLGLALQGAGRLDEAQGQFDQANQLGAKP